MKIIFMFCLFVVFNYSLSANNISITNINLSDQNTAEHNAIVSFDISWENSWRTSSLQNNWDAAWVFIKYRITGGEWHSAAINTTGFTAPAGSMITPAADSTGMFIYRDSDGSGTNIFNNVQLRWNYGADGVPDNANVDVKVFAIEMVYIPEGSYYAGSGGSEQSAFYTYPDITNPYQITSEDEMIVAPDTGKLYYSFSSFGGDQMGPIPSPFPKGYNAFYCMKYEISQQAYVDFLNCLWTSQASKRFSFQGASSRYGLVKTGVVYSTSSPFLPCSFLNWADLAAYLDWCGLRPLTELEYEKACRGTLFPVPDEYAWGTTEVAITPYTISGTGTAIEKITENYSTTAGNAAYNLTTPRNGSIRGPVRVGVFAGDSLNTGRVTAGATFYGVMEMSGSLLEHFVTVGNPEGREFTGTHGDGEVDANANADAVSWPGQSSLGGGFRGGYWYYHAWYLRISERGGAAGTDPVRYDSDGGRGGRTAPLAAI